MRFVKGILGVIVTILLVPLIVGVLCLSRTDTQRDRFGEMLIYTVTTLWALLLIGGFSVIILEVLSWMIYGV